MPIDIPFLKLSLPYRGSITSAGVATLDTPRAVAGFGGAAQSMTLAQSGGIAASTLFEA